MLGTLEASPRVAAARRSDARLSAPLRELRSQPPTIPERRLGARTCPVARFRDDHSLPPRSTALISTLPQRVVSILVLTVTDIRDNLTEITDISDALGGTLDEHPRDRGRDRHPALARMGPAHLLDDLEQGHSCREP